MFDRDSIIDNPNIPANFVFGRGGALYVGICPQLTITNTNFTNNVIEIGKPNPEYRATCQGAAVYLAAAINAHFDNCDFDLNKLYARGIGGSGQPGSSVAQGGAVYLNGPGGPPFNTARFDSCNFSNPSIQTVQGVRENEGSFFFSNFNTDMTFRNCEFRDNNTISPSEAFYVRYGANIDFDHCLFENIQEKVFETENDLESLKVTNSIFRNCGQTILSLIGPSDLDIGNCLFDSIETAVSMASVTGNNLRMYNTTIRKASSTAVNLTGNTNNFSIYNCTMVDNSQDIAAASGIFMKNNILTYTVFNASPAITLTGSGAIASGGGNIVRDNSGLPYLFQTNDLSNTILNPGPFANHGGFSETYALPSGSQAIDLGGTDTLSFDQRGFARTGLVDAGAYEFGATDPNLIGFTSQSGNAIVCAGDSVSFFVIATGQNLSYQWQLNGVDIFGETQDILSFGTTTVGDAGNYQCVVNNGVNTQTSNVMVLTVNALPIVSAGVGQSVCLGGSVTLSGSGAQSYSWDNNVVNGQAFTPAVAGVTTYTVTGTDGNNCSDTDTVSVTVNALPAVSAGTAQTVCLGDPVTLTGSGAQSYSWDNNVVNGQAFTPAVAGTTTYTVTGTDGNNCTNTDTVSVTVLSVDTTVTQTGNTFSVITPATAYQWLDCNNGFAPIAGEVAASFTPAMSGSYAVAVTDGNCTDTSSCRTITITAISEAIPLTFSMNMFPNPGQDYLDIRFSQPLTKARIVLYDLRGKEIASAQLEDSDEYRFSAIHLAKGQYVVVVLTENGLLRGKWVKN